MESVADTGPRADAAGVPAAHAGIALIDVAEAFAPVGDKASYFSADHYHPNPKGAEFIASVIADRWSERP